MPLSQFTVYMSADSGSPALTGQTGSLISLLDACLVTGYASKPAAGWSKPAFPATSSLGAYQQASGSRLFLYINDSGPVTTSAAQGKEAWATGWENITAYTSSAVSASVGAGTGQFPLPSQVLTTGHYVIRKSATTDSVARPWIIFADAYTMYMFIYNGDGSIYSGFIFGDVFSLKPTTDTYKCAIQGRVLESTSNNTSVEGIATISSITSNPSIQYLMYFARSFGGFGQSTAASKTGDLGKTGINSQYASTLGTVLTPNPVDNSYYLAPLQVYETTGPNIRGRLRGVYHLCHPIASFSDGQVFSGANEYAGKTFMVINPIMSNASGGGMLAIEISATVETN